MLGKLVKNELKSYRFSVGIVFLAAVIFTIFMKVICMLPYHDDTKELVQIMGFYGYYYIIMLVSVATQVLIVIRFYSTMVGDRGYLTWTLPASSSTHIWSKLIGGMVWKTAADVVTIVLLVFFFVGDYWGISLSELFVELENLFEYFEIRYLIPIILALVLMFVCTVTSMLLFYLCIAIGQLFGKWRIPASIGCYFLIIVLFEVISIMVIGIFSVAGLSVFNTTFLEDASVAGILSVVFLVLIVLAVIVAAILFAVTNIIFKKHLNLE